MKNPYENKNTEYDGGCDKMKSDIKNSPLEGWTAKQDGVENSDWKGKSLFPYWDLPKNNNLIPKSRELRKAGNLAEVIFWKSCNKNGLAEWDIDRQIIIGNYIVDFFIPELGLIFEIDGSTHNDKFEYDMERDRFFKSFGLGYCIYKIKM